MLLEFRTSNYKSFKGELCFSLIPAPKQKGLDYSVSRTRIGKKIYKGLSSAVIYGPNASGKTNIIGAMDTFKTIILRGHIRNDEGIVTPNMAAKDLELIPNRSVHVHDSPPVTFSIKFIEAGLLIEYSLSLDIGDFLEATHKRRILYEMLSVNEKKIFVRSDSLVIHYLDSIKEYLINTFEANAEGAIAIAENNLNDEELFLMNGFKVLFSSKLIELISQWLDNKFMVIYRADSLHLISKFSNPKKNSVYIERTLNEAARYFGINSNALGYVVSGEDGDKAKLCSLFKDNKVAIPAEIFESYGTIRFVNIFPLVVKAILEGSTLVVDEFDASIHPMALMNIINIFHNDDINIYHAQLVFDTHNPIFLNSNLFRRDEIKFVERDEDKGSVQYSLADFGTAGKSGVRRDGDYIKNYFIDRYGAIEDIDFTPIFKDLLQLEDEV